MSESFDILRKPIISEKASDLQGSHKYTFEVSRSANKQQIINVPIVVLMPKAIPNAIPKRLLCDKESPK